jgi:ABC-type uncharacterized transport system auxiliary subunit
MKRFFFLFLALLFALYGCSRKAVIRKYYLIEIPKIPNSNVMESTPLTEASCEVLPLTISPAFATDRITARLETHELTYYVFHQWAVKPQDALFQLIESHLQDTQIFTSVSGRFWKLIPDYQLQTRVYQLEAIQDEDKLTAHLNIDFALIDNILKQVAVFHYADKYQILERNNMNLFAEAVSELFYAEMQLFSGKIKAFIQNEKKQK